MSEKAKRHDWSPSLEQHCRNVGCYWQRRFRDNGRGESTTTAEYRWQGRDTWERPSRVPPCEGTR
jgi:hypothetical protein